MGRLRSREGRALPWVTRAGQEQKQALSPLKSLKGPIRMAILERNGWPLP